MKSLKAFGLSLLFFVSVSAIYMNHYSHSKWFYFWNCLDAIIVLGIVAVAGGLIYPRLFKEDAGRVTGIIHPGKT